MWESLAFGCCCWVLIIGNTQQDQRVSWTPVHRGPQRLLHGREVSHKRGCEYNHLLPHVPARGAIYQEMVKNYICFASQQEKNSPCMETGEMVCTLINAVQPNGT